MGLCCPRGRFSPFPCGIVFAVATLTGCFYGSKNRTFAQDFAMIQASNAVNYQQRPDTANCILPHSVALKVADKPAAMTGALCSITATTCRQQSCGLATTSTAHTSGRFPTKQGLAYLPRTFRQKSRRLEFAVNTYPEPETEKERSPLDYPQASGSAAALNAVGGAISMHWPAAFAINS